ncbi:MAG: endopeptidase La [Vicinamibacteria bacterium]|jgi:ATP-dependent Lon protease|nr:endopeptidase La [Vicinamibacteria bacterium]
MSDTHDERTITIEETPDAPNELAILPLRDTILFPHAVLPLAVARDSSVALVNEAVHERKVIGVITQRDPAIDAPVENDLHRVGTITHIHKMFKFPDGSLRLVVQGVQRFRLRGIPQYRPYLKASIEPLNDFLPPDKEVEARALAQSVQGLFQRVVELSPTLNDELQSLASNIQDPSRLADFVAASLTTLDTAQKQELLEVLDIHQRLERVNAILVRDLEVLEVGNKIQSQVKTELQKNQREYYLREQMKAIQRELGEGDDQQREINELREKIEKANMPEEAKKEALHELDRLSRMTPAAAEHTVTRTYLDWLIALPWNKRTEAEIDIRKAKEVLDNDHSDLEKVKDRILEYLAVRKMKPDIKGPILCFVGPPGVGKTSLGKSIASALGRKFHRISLGGMRDEAEIRGHRRTYIGALPGQIIQGLRRAESKNPVFMLDEVDKIGTDFRGDPAAALLEVLDPEQNNTFKDHYIDLPFDLSEVLFITTANILDTVPPALRDRMEVIRLAGYTEEEKLHIARRHIIPRQLENHGMTSESVAFGDEALIKLIREYTREAGLRNLEREIASIIRKVARRRAEGETSNVAVIPSKVEDFLGAPYFVREEIEERTLIPGVVIGLSWTAAGGEVLFIEATQMWGQKGLTLTGQLGDVMKESAQAALSWVRAHSRSLGIEESFFERVDLHLHIPEGAIPKDGPSAGITLVSSLVSLITNRPARALVAMTGEITLSGRILPVGGIKEKVLAAHRIGLKEVILPKRNEKAVKEDISEAVRNEIKIHLVSTIEEALAIAITPVDVHPPIENRERWPVRLTN